MIKNGVGLRQELFSMSPSGGHVWIRLCGEEQSVASRLLKTRQRIHRMRS